MKIGDRVSPYEIIEALGAGGMGVVYKALDTRLKRTVALNRHMAGLTRVRMDVPGSRRFDAVWLFPPTYIIHLGEEYLAAGGFPLWAERTLAIRFSSAEFTAWSTLALGLMCLGGWLVSRDPKFRFIEIALAVAVLGNVAVHVFASILTWTYSPGLVSGVLIWIPLGALRLQRARRASTRRGYVAGVYLGLFVVLITIAVVVVGAFVGR